MDYVSWMVGLDRERNRVLFNRRSAKLIGAQWMVKGFNRDLRKIRKQIKECSTKLATA